jgi:phosphopantothenoylcysteine decarboxylase/phosphopantothenate--cysteine ligase
MGMLKDKHVTLYVTGSIAAYKSALLTRLLIKAGAQVQVVMTAAATDFVTPLTFQTLSKRPVLTDLFTATEGDPIKHITVADWTDIALVAPAAANILAKMAQGLADDAASSTLIATAAPKFVAPAMNKNMWANPATARNVQQLRADGVLIIDPAEGFLAEGYSGSGRLAEPATIVAALEAYLQDQTPQPLRGKRVLVTAGGTREAIDPVRYVGNKSSGKMGYALARAARDLGADVTLISSTSLATPHNVDLVPVVSAAEMAAAVNTYFADSEITFMAAAVADFRPEAVVDHKIKKQDDTSTLDLHLVRTPDILAGLGKQKRADQFLLGFAAETNDLLQNAQKKLVAKGADMIVANDVSDTTIGFNSDANRVTLLKRDAEPEQLAMASKDEIARDILLRVCQQLHLA